MKFICNDCQRLTIRKEKPCTRCGGVNVEMLHTNKMFCQCNDCQEEGRAIERQLNHPFYHEANEFREAIEYETMLKAAKKYKEPFNPNSWSIEQLAKHAMAENYDQQNYIYGMYKKLQTLQKEIDILKGDAGAEEQYLYILRDVLENGVKKEDRTGTGVISSFGRHRMVMDLAQGFPLLTTKRMDLKKVMAEYFAFIRGETNANVIADEYGFSIWKLWGDENGELGPIYGKQWRDWQGYNNNLLEFVNVDQLQEVIDEIKTNPNSRRLIVSSWNVAELDEMRLPPCHLLYQFNVTKGRLNCQLYQRSGDLFLGIPYNMAGYAALTHMVAQLTGLQPGTLTHTIADAHIYLNHIDQVKEQLTREPRPLPKLSLMPQNNINDYWFNHIDVIRYDPWPAIKGAVSK